MLVKIEWTQEKYRNMFTLKITYMSSVKKKKEFMKGTKGGDD